MKVLCPNKKIEFEIDEKIALSVSLSSGNQREHYSFSSYEFLLNLNEIETPARNNGQLWFRDNESVTEIVRGFKSTANIPAIEVTTRGLAGYKKYRVKDGFHRYWFSHIAGFTRIPVKLNNFVISDLD
jgi:hypothetical protein